METYTNSLLIFLALLFIGYVAGTLAEKKHYRSIANREKAYLHLAAVNAKTIPHSNHAITSAKLVYGSTVISTDYFKSFLAIIRNTFGGTVKSYESLMDRARRESLLRMKEMAHGASIIINVRIETSNIAGASSRSRTTCLEAIAYGTALYLEK